MQHTQIYRHSDTNKDIITVNYWYNEAKTMNCTIFNSIKNQRMIPFSILLSWNIMTLSIMYDKKCHYTIISVAGILIYAIGEFRFHQYTPSFKDYAYMPFCSLFRCVFKIWYSYVWFIWASRWTLAVILLNLCTSYNEVVLSRAFSWPWNICRSNWRHS